MARRISADDGRPRGPRRAVLLGWLAAAAAIALLAFIVGRPDAAIPAPSPSPEDGPQPIRFGTDIDPATGEALDLTDEFRPGDSFVYSLVPAEPLEAEMVTLEILRFEDGELISEQVAQIPAGQVIGRSLSADEMLEFYGSGEFVMRIYLDPEDPLGEGRFTLLDPPAAS
jgi:hypothetical protein